jgi:hypothetical protein
MRLTGRRLLQIRLFQPGGLQFSLDRPWPPAGRDDATVLVGVSVAPRRLMLLTLVPIYRAWIF